MDEEEDEQENFQEIYNYPNFVIEEKPFKLKNLSKIYTYSIN
jgi:hypothetical protein